MTLRDKLKIAAKLKKRESIKLHLSEKFSLQESDVTIFEQDFQNIVDLAEQKGIEIKEGVFEISFFEGCFRQFIDNFNSTDTVSFMISTENDYFFAKIPFSALQRDPSFFWNDKILHFTNRNRIFLKSDMSSAFIILSSEYGLELSQW